MPGINSKRKFSETINLESSSSMSFLPGYQKNPAINSSRLIKHILKKFGEEKFSELEADKKIMA